jgi:hypothetical protein
MVWRFVKNQQQWERLAYFVPDVATAPTPAATGGEAKGAAPGLLDENESPGHHQRPTVVVGHPQVTRLPRFSHHLRLDA